MIRPTRHAVSLIAVAYGAAILSAFVACADPERVAVVPTAPQFAKAPSGPSVSGATPAYGRRGQTGEQVTITGSGFAAGAVVSWERGGAADSKIIVQGTQVISSTQIVATIDIAANADVAFYDIAVINLDKKKGIGTEKFEVTQAISIGSLGGNTVANGGNDNAEIVGYTIASSGQRAFYWSAATDSMIDIGGTNALGIDQAGTTIVGTGVGSLPLVWSRSGGSWVSSPLPVGPAASGGRPWGLASNPVTGVASIIGGAELISQKRGSLHQPRLWTRTTGGWQKVDRPMPFANVSGTFSWVAAVNANGQAAGAVRPGGGGAMAVAWEANGADTVLGPGGANAINSAGTIIAGFNGNDAAAYYQRAAVGDPWTGPFVLPGGCRAAMGIDDAGRIIANDCPIPGSSRVTSAVFSPPSYTSFTRLGGLGDVTEGGKAFGIAPDGTVAFGTAPTKPTRVAVIWRDF